MGYAKAVLSDPVQKAYYEKKKKKLGLSSAYQAAITDYMRKLRLELVNRKAYTGEVGGRIVMTIRKKDFGVREVKVMLLSQHSGELIESGAASDAHGTWIYKNTVRVNDVGDVIVRVMARGAGGWEALE